MNSRCHVRYVPGAASFRCCIPTVIASTSLNANPVDSATTGDALGGCCLRLRDMLRSLRAVLENCGKWLLDKRMGAFISIKAFKRQRQARIAITADPSTCHCQAGTGQNQLLTNTKYLQTCRAQTKSGYVRNSGTGRLAEDTGRSAVVAWAGRSNWSAAVVKASQIATIVSAGCTYNSAQTTC